MKEVFQISNRITVLRDGKLITTVDAKDTDQETMVKTMAGRDIDLSNKYRGQSIGDVIYSGKKRLCARRVRRYQLRRKERARFSGLQAAWAAAASSSAKKLYGLDP